jgi:hypothetical protein
MFMRGLEHCIQRVRIFPETNILGTLRRATSGNDYEKVAQNGPVYEGVAKDA